MTCLFCEKEIEPGEPFSSCLIMPTPTTSPMPAPFHLACQIDTIAGEVAATILESEKLGRPSRRLRAPGRELRDKLFELARELLVNSGRG